jgi:hypothetical protein
MKEGSRSTTQPMFRASFFAGITTVIRRPSRLMVSPARPSSCRTGMNLPVLL